VIYRARLEEWVDLVDCPTFSGRCGLGARV
jgi:hypothetical protein